MFSDNNQSDNYCLKKNSGTLEKPRILNMNFNPTFMTMLHSVMGHKSWPTVHDISNHHAFSKKKGDLKCHNQFIDICAILEATTPSTQWVITTVSKMLTVLWATTTPSTQWVIRTVSRMLTVLWASVYVMGSSRCVTPVLLLMEAEMMLELTIFTGFSSFVSISRSSFTSISGQIISASGGTMPSPIMFSARVGSVAFLGGSVLIYSSGASSNVSVFGEGSSLWAAKNWPKLSNVRKINLARPKRVEENKQSKQILYLYGSGHETAAVLLPGFAINW